MGKGERIWGLLEGNIVEGVGCALPAQVLVESLLCNRLMTGTVQLSLFFLDRGCGGNEG